MIPAPLLALALATPIAAPAPDAGPEHVRTSDIPVALVLSGGVSLGSYEAGLSWAVVEFSRRTSSRPLAAGSGAPRLVALTGASAGSINALLSAVLWCSAAADGEDSVDHNLLREVWAPVGLDTLLPDDPGGYEPADALLSTRPLLESIDRFQRWIAAARFRPGCRVPVGLTVTRDRAAEHDVGALTVRTQRFALPWRLEVDADGVARIVSQRLGAARADVLEVAGREHGGAEATVPWPQVMQGILASAAFPVAFRARELCDCSARCPAANQVTSGTCEGPRGPISQLSCPARSAEGEPLTLCSHRYVDGGIFDNTPVGLNVDLAESVSAAQPLQPLTYVYIDPDVRRLRPVTPETPSSLPARTPASGQNLADAARLAAELVATARTEDLARTLQGRGWNVTTRSLLYETAASLRSFAAVQRDAALQLGRPDGPLPRPDDGAPRHGGHPALASVLLRCFPEHPPVPEVVRSCVRELSDVAAGRGPAASAAEPGMPEVIAVAEAMRDAATRALRGDAPRAVRDAEVFAEEMRIGAVGMTFLGDEMTRVARTSSGPALKRFRAALLGTIQLGRVLGVEVAHLANAAALAELEPLASDGTAGAAAARAAAALRAAPDVLFVPDDLEPVVDALARAGTAEPALRSLRALVRVAPALQAEIVRVNRLARAADALQQTRTERALVVSSRFAPITGSQLGNFGAFLDRPFRDYDYYAGVYDASHAIAVALCDAEAVSGAPRPVRDPASPTALELRARDTQRCVGTALDVVLRALDVDGSATAGHVVRRLARAELEASLGDAGAGQLEGESAWAWLSRPPPALPEQRVAIVADTLISSRVACAPDVAGSCIRELSFDELVAALRERGYAPTDLAMRALLEDPDAWTRHSVRRLLDRSYQRELENPRAYELAPAVLLAHRVGELWVRSPHGSGPFPRFVLDPSTIPGGPEPVARDVGRFAAHLLPYRLELDVARGGVSASWLDPTWWLGARTSIAAELTAVAYEAAHGGLSSSVALLPTGHLAGLGIGAGPRLAVRWKDASVAAGAAIRVSAFQQRVSVAFGSESLRGRGRDLFVTLGVSDLNGALFWLAGR